MKYVTLLRHAKADFSADGGDIARDLSARGRSDAAVVADRVRTALPTPEVICASNARRVTRTLEVYRDRWIAAGAAFPMWQEHAELYLAETDVLWATAERELATVDDLWIVGHNPGLADAVALFAAGELRYVPTSAVIRIAFGRHAVAPGEGRVVYFDCPKANRG